MFIFFTSSRPIMRCCFPRSAKARLQIFGGDQNCLHHNHHDHNHNYYFISFRSGKLSAFQLLKREQSLLSRVHPHHIHENPYDHDDHHCDNHNHHHHDHHHDHHDHQCEDAFHQLRRPSFPADGQLCLTQSKEAAA